MCVLLCGKSILFVVGGEEHRRLKPSQFAQGSKPDQYTYTENGSKNHQGTFGTRTESNKVDSQSMKTRVQG